MGGSELRIVLALGTAQTLAWASSYYLPAILADPIARDLGVSSNWIFAAFSGALVISALLGPRVGRRIDAVGGRQVLSISNVVMAAGLAMLGWATNLTWLIAAWLLLGIGMGMGLYDAAFATLGRIYGSSARRAITGITLLAGFASTVGWPLSAWGLETIGWRNTCFAWAAAHLVIGLPLNLFFLPSVPKQTPQTEEAAAPVHVSIDRSMVLLAIAFASAWAVTSAIAAHLPRMLEAAGATTVQAIAAGALIGPAQVAARVFEASLMTRFHPLVSARLACITHPIGAAVLLTAGGGVAASAFAVLHGAGNGILTIARGTLPLAIFGPVNYGYRLGLLGAPSRMTQALAPLAFGFLLDSFGQNIFLISSALSLIALAALFALRRITPDVEI
ncbi:MAG: hypothetical protein A4S14_14030 [Proteobacteria bacterium SG_bin9]|nr:MAG: hypothetical protein A4S14_14030 [Proteobacteria bacterium SG_bin9]